MSKFVEIKNENKCPQCNAPLMYKTVPSMREPQSMEVVQQARAWYCSRCGKIFRKLEDMPPIMEYKINQSVE